MKNLDSYIKNAIFALINHGVTIDLHRRKSRFDYYDDDSRTISCSTSGNQLQWRGRFIHEYCHFLQWKEGRFSDDIYLDSIGEFNEWLENKKKRIKKKELLNIVNRIKRVEIDCEKKVVKEIKKNLLEIDIKDYIRKANAYIFSYNMQLETRQIYTATLEGNNELISSMSDKFLSRYDRTPKKYRKFYMEHCT